MIVADWMSRARYVVSRWLFREGGEYNCAMARIAVGVALWLTITHNGNFSGMALNYSGWLQGVAGLVWAPKGLAKLPDLVLPGPPPEALVYWAYQVGLVSIVMMIAGIFSRVSQVVATIATIYVVSLQTSWGPYWSHAYNVQLLAAMAFMFARSGDRLSLDYLLRMLLKRPTELRQGHYWWPVLFAEAATALFMFGAFFQKFRETGIYWAISDNIRNALAITWFQYRSDPPDLAVLLGSHPILWQGAGLLQLFTQCTTILAVVLVARPVFRLVFGGIFMAMEVLGLAILFRFWHPFWLPLSLLSVDYEHFWGVAKRHLSREPQHYGSLMAWFLQKRIALAGDRISPPMPRRLIGFVLTFGMIFFGYYCANLYFRLGETQLNYPFSTMGFYSETRAAAPYGERKYWPIYTGRADAYVDGNLVEFGYRVSGIEDQLYRVDSITALRRLDESFRAVSARGVYLRALPGADEAYHFTPISPDKVIYRAGQMAVQPYPAPLSMVDFNMPYRAVWDGGKFRAIVAKTEWDEAAGKYGIVVDSAGFTSPRFEIWHRAGARAADHLREPVPLKGQWEGSKFWVDDNFDEAYLLVKVLDDTLGVEELYYGADVF